MTVTMAVVHPVHMRYSLAAAVPVGAAGVCAGLALQNLWVAPISYADALPAAVVFAAPILVWWRRSRANSES